MKNRWTPGLACALAALLLPAAAFGQSAAADAPAGPAVEPSTAAPSTAPPAPIGGGSPRVTAVVSDQAKHPDRAGLGDRITVSVSDLPALIAQAGNDCKGIVLFLAGIALPATPPERCDPMGNSLGFYLERNKRTGGADQTDRTDAAWRALLGRPGGFTRAVAVSVGPSADRALPTEVDDFNLVVVRPSGFYLFVIGFGVIVILFAILARRSNLLRDAAARPAPGQRPPFSLSRFQMAFWLLLVVAAYLFLWIITGELDSLTDSVLALIGIGSGTALGAAMIDSGKQESAAKANGQLAGRAETLRSTIAVLQQQFQAPGTDAKSMGEELAARKGQLVQVEASMAAQGEPGRQASTGSFIRDVLGDAGGISIHRFQMFVWTLVLGMIFVGSVYRSLEMPEFSATMLGLMGISSGTYLGFKFPEQPGKASGGAANGDDAEALPPLVPPPANPA
jgi:hypothetical protein